MKFTKLFATLCLMGSSLWMNNAVAEEEVDEHGKYQLFRQALLDDNKEMFLSSFNYPVEMCINNELRHFDNASQLSAYSMEDILGGPELFKKFKEVVKERDHGEFYETAYDNLQVSGLFVYVSEKLDANLGYTAKGIHQIHRSNCNPKIVNLKFCNNVVQDAHIRMLTVNNMWEYPYGEFENFLDHSYSKILINSDNNKLSKELNFIIDGKAIKGKRVEGFYNDAPVFTDGKDQYMILSSSENDENLCIEGMCQPVHYFHIYKKDGDTGTCEDIVLTEKYSLNFCPYDRRQSSEIAYYNNGFEFDTTTYNAGTVFSSSSNSTTVSFELGLSCFEGEKVRPLANPIPEDCYEQTVMALNYQGKKYYRNVDKHMQFVFNAGDLEILAVPEGDFDAKTENYRDKHLMCALDFVCQRNAKRMVLFVRNKEGMCERVVLDQAVIK